MTPGDTTPGRRRDVYPHEMQPGDYGKPSGSWWCKTPSGGGGNLNGHEVEEHEDGTITVSPSILVSVPGQDASGWHGYLERGVWREV